jgi:hypothetical protein
MKNSELGNDREKADDGTIGEIDGKPVIYFDGYWIRYYAPPEDSMDARQLLIEHLTRRAFHHTEAGINTPGNRLEEARAAYESETDPRRKRVNAAMLAGALFNRATDIFHSIVNLDRAGVSIGLENELMRQCGGYLREAMELGKQVKHISGEEGIDELWGEPLKAFTMPVAEFYRSRYVKIAQAMGNIDEVLGFIIGTFREEPAFNGIEPLVNEFSEAAKIEAETTKSDPVIFRVWPRFVSAGERLLAFQPRVDGDANREQRRRVDEGLRLLHAGKRLITYVAGARVPMPKSTAALLARCAAYADAGKCLR